MIRPADSRDQLLAQLFLRTGIFAFARKVPMARDSTNARDPRVQTNPMKFPVFGKPRSTSEWVALTALDVGVVADRLERQHRHDLLGSMTASPRIYETAHLFCLEVRWLFVREEGEAN